MVGEQAKARLQSAKAAQGGRAKIQALFPGAYRQPVVRQADAVGSKVRSALAQHFPRAFGRQMDALGGSYDPGYRALADGSSVYTSQMGRYVTKPGYGFRRLG